MENNKKNTKELNNAIDSITFENIISLKKQVQIPIKDHLRCYSIH